MKCVLFTNVMFFFMERHICFTQVNITIGEVVVKLIISVPLFFLVEKVVYILALKSTVFVCQISLRRGGTLSGK